jgi:hypothetical protein
MIEDELIDRPVARRRRGAEAPAPGVIANTFARDW